MSTLQNVRLWIQIETCYRTPVAPPPPPPATAAEGDRFFSIKAYYMDMSPLHAHAVDINQAPQIVPQSEFFSLGPAIVRRIFTAVGVSLPDEVLNLITPPGFADFSAFLVGHPRAADTVLPILVSIMDNLPRRPVRAPAASGLSLTVPARAEAIAALEVVTAVSGDECSVCLEDFDKVKDTRTVEMQVVRTPCSHVFHRHCLVRWLRSNRMCPLCRYALS